MLRISLSYDKTCQTLTGEIADHTAGCLLASVMLAYDVHRAAANKLLWSDILLTSKTLSPHQPFVRDHASTMISGAILRYLADRHNDQDNIGELLRGLTHPSELLMVLGSFNVIYEVEDPQVLVDIANQFSPMTGATPA